MIENLFFRLLACVFIILCFVLYVYVRKLRSRLADTCMMLGQSATGEAVRRSSIDSVSNIVVSPSIYGKECILVDDVCTSGASIRDHVQELRRYGVKVTGVVCLGRTVEYHEGSRIIYATALRDSNLSFLERVLNRIY